VLLRGKFLEVFFCPGNHDLWVRGEGSWRVAPVNPLAPADRSAAPPPQDSLAKLRAVFEICQAVGRSYGP
jgi:hypothetical protein